MEFKSNLNNCILCSIIYNGHEEFFYFDNKEKTLMKNHNKIVYMFQLCPFSFLHKEKC